MSGLYPIAKLKFLYNKDTNIKRMVIETIMDENKKKALAATLNNIQKKYGQGAVMKMSENKSMEVEVVSTGSLNLDIALGVGGIPKGRVIEIFGPESTGKSTLAMHMVAEVQKRGGVAMYIDAEHAMDPAYAKKLGCNIDELLISQPDNGEEALEICDTAVRGGAIDIVVVDSVAALVPIKELEGEMGDAVVGLQARLMSQGLRKLTASIDKSKCIVIFINQLREKIGVMYGNPETTTGGKALKFYASVRLDIRRIESIKSGGEVIGNHVRVKVVKNKVAPPFREAEFDIIFGKGISKDGEIVDAAVSLGIINKGGSWFTYSNTETGRNERWQGKEKVKEALANDAPLKEEIENQVVNRLRMPKDQDNETIEQNDVEPLDE